MRTAAMEYPADGNWTALPMRSHNMSAPMGRCRSQLNVWTAMFAEQALALTYREPREIARIAAAPSIV